MIIHLEADILEYAVKWALGSITTNKASGGDRMSVKLFQILKDDAVKVQFSSVQFSLSVVSDSLGPHGLQHVRPLCPTTTPRVYSNSCPFSR